ncbi:MAG: hypothetical protein ACLFSF_03095, partial [Desulfonatronovibrio sp.]
EPWVPFPLPFGPKIKIFNVYLLEKNFTRTTCSCSACQQQGLSCNFRLTADQAWHFFGVGIKRFLADLVVKSPAEYFLYNQLSTAC